VVYPILEMFMDELRKKLNSGQPSIWLVGDASYPEFREVVSELQETARVTAMKSVRAAAEANVNSTPDIVVVLQSRPGTLRTSEIEAIRQKISRPKVILLLSSWCEGELPGRRPAAGIERVLWHEFVSWWRSRMPQVPRLHRAGRGLIAIDAAWRETADALSDALEAEGYATLWLPRGRSMPRFGGVMLGIWDGGQFDPPERFQFLNFRQRLEEDGAPLVTLLDFPRQDRRDLAIELGAAAVLGKPVSIDCLVQTLDELSTQQTRRTTIDVPKAA
jgi:hypothetical protein